MLCSLRFMGICEERQRQGPSHPVMCLHRNSQHSNLNITLTLTAACFDLKFPLLCHFGSRCYFLFCFCLFFFFFLTFVIETSFPSYSPVHILVFWPHHVWHDVLVGDNHSHIYSGYHAAFNEDIPISVFTVDKKAKQIFSYHHLIGKSSICN